MLEIFKRAYHNYLSWVMVMALMIVGLNGYTQSKMVNSTIDSLTRVMNGREGVEKFDALYELVKATIGNNLDSALALSSDAEKMSLQLNDSLRMVRAKYLRGALHYKKALFNESIAILKESLSIAERNQFEVEQTNILNFLAVDYTFIGNYDKALQCHFLALDLNEKRKNWEDVGISYNNIGVVYYKLFDFSSALDFFLKSLETKKSLGSSFDLDRLMINIAFCYNNLNQYKEAEKFIERGLDVCKENCDPAIRMEAELGLGISIKAQGRKEEAIDHLKTSLSIAKEIGQKRYQVENLQSMASIKTDQGLNEEALVLLLEAEGIGINTQYPSELLEVYNVFSKVYNNLNDFKNASKYQLKYIQLKDSIFSEDLIKNLGKVQANYAERENIKTIKEKDQVLQLKEQLIDRQRTQYFFTILIVMLVLGLALVLLIAIRRQQRSSTEIAGAKVRIEEQNKLLEGQNKILDDRVKARTVELSKSNLLLTEVNAELDNFLYKTSHDIRGPLATMQGLCNLGIIESKDEVVTDILRQLVSQSDRMSKILSRLTAISNINQASLNTSKIDFIDILEGIMKAERENCLSRNISVTYQIDTSVQMISDELLVRTILENLVSNGIKFYNSSARIESYVRINVTQDGTNVFVRVEDNGIGIPDAKPDQVFHMFMRASERSETGGVGLYLSKVCTDRLGGEIKLERSGKDGTSFLVLFPIDLVPVLARRRQWLDGFQKLQEDEENQKLTPSS